ncbi:uncharacterized protein LOC143838304 [Paroedura picta]|uniref:uncharacterized protein LOC143838304 n=1 Tax=Paroedura picta TaxID=143630 RepID=UPI0040579EAE
MNITRTSTLLQYFFDRNSAGEAFLCISSTCSDWVQHDMPSVYPLILGHTPKNSFCPCWRSHVTRKKILKEHPKKTSIEDMHSRRILHKCKTSMELKKHLYT